ncbi:uncharacterized protein LOC135087923 [Ostrinia nubilalis]|uniref:uncharacterized protein LOC114360974 n=1 Tax=Ostrinia furnacalis TaxID=93504 RepID=UPI00103A3017|nr:uncharacterized protein LOC114360974 [Ostrinia furnacalis]
MEVPKLIILLCCTYYCVASHHQSHIIPVEGYDTELQDLGQHVEIPETPVKVIKITKTIAVKVPVPYPVKVREKVPYPVHVAKPYPVPVPQIIKVPHIVSPKSGHQHEGGDEGKAYQVQEDSWSNGENSYAPEGHSFEGAHSRQGQNYGEDSYGGSPISHYDSPASSYYGHSGNSDSNLGNDSDESKSYDQAIKEYFNKHQPSGDSGSSNSYNYH